MAGKGFSVTITAVDQASAKIDQINKRLAAAQAQVKKLESERSKEEGKAGSAVLAKGFDGLKRGIAGVPEGIGKIQRGFGDLASRARDAFQAVGQIVTPLAAITGAASIAGLARLTTGWANTTQQLGFAADRANMTIGQFKSLRDAMMLMGTSTEGAEQAIIGFKDTITNAIGGHDTDAVGYFQQLGISMDDLKNKSPVELMKMVMAGMANVGDATLRTRIQTGLFKDSSAALMHVLAQMPEALDANMEKARQYAGLTDEQRKKADDLANAQKDLGLAVSGLTGTLSAELSPVLTPLLIDLAKWIVSLKDNKEFMDQLRGAVRGFGDAIKGINWHEVWESIKGIAKGVNDAVQAFGGWERAGETLGAVLLLKVLSPLTSIVATLGNLVALRLPLWLLSLLGVSGGAVATGAALTAGVAAGYKGATKSGEEIATQAAQGATPAMIDQFGNAIGYRDKDGNYKTGHEDQDNKPGLIRRGLNWWYGKKEPGAEGAPAPAPAPGGQGAPAPAPGAEAPAPGAQGLPAPANDQGGPMPGATPEHSMGADANTRSANVMAGLMRDTGMTQEQAAAVVGNLRAESGMEAINEKKPLVPGSRGGFGWAQWTGPRRVAFEKFAAENKLDVKSDEANYRFLLKELHDNPRYQASLRGHEHDVAGGTAAWQKSFEGPAVIQDRSRHAQAAMTAYNTQQANGPPVNVAGGTGSPNVVAANGTQTVRGSADVNIRLQGFPPGTRTTASTEGDLFNKPTIERAMPMAAAA